MDQQPAEQSGFREFLGDLKLAFAAWGEAPLLPLMSMGVFAGIAALNQPTRDEPGYFAVILIAVSLSSLGWYGSERLWYLRIFRKKPFGPVEAIRGGFRFIIPFLLLGLNIFLRTLPFLFLALLSTAWEDVNEWWASLFYGISIDIVATFMTPALVFSTRSSNAAAREGWKTLKESWPHCAWYALVPPVAIVTSLQIAEIDSGPRIALTAMAALVALWFKGAIAAYFLRRHPEVGDYGSLSEAATISKT